MKLGRRDRTSDTLTLEEPLGSSEVSGNGHEGDGVADLADMAERDTPTARHAAASEPFGSLLVREGSSARKTSHRP